MSGLIGKKFTLDPTLGCSPGNARDGVVLKGYGASLTESNGTAKLEKCEAGAGLWVPYAETKAVVGYMTGSQIWVASGPFSGCQFAIVKGGGLVFAAHIAQQSGSTGAEDYAKYRSESGLSEWYMNKIPMPNQMAFSCSYVFVLCGDGGINHMARVDVNVTTMGGSNGTVTNVHTFK
ncbi:MAG: hypothetical protein Q8N44_13800 [Rubrivivax sp.]|nr:hypothetical protein [Rubrivivax sp.]